MRLVAEGTVGMTGSNVPVGITVGGSLVYLAPVTTNGATIRVGKTTPQLAVVPTDEKGFTIPESDPQGLIAIGTSGDILRYAVWG